MGSNTKPVLSTTAIARRAGGVPLRWAMRRASWRPTLPKPSSTTSVCGAVACPPPPILASWNWSWICCWALAASAPLTTTERFSSDEPCAIETTLMPAAGQGGEHARHDPGRVRHPRPDHGQRGHARPHLDPVDLAARDLVRERLQQRGLRAGRARLRHREADRVFGGGLRDQRDGDAAAVHRAEGAGGDAGNPEHAVAGDRDQGLVLDRGDGLDRIAGQGAAPETSVPVEAGSAKGRTRTRTSRPMIGVSGARVQRLGAVIGELRGLAHVELRDEARVGHGARIRGEQAGHVLPQRDLARPQRAAEQRRR